MPPPATVLFDLDGTLVDHIPGIRESLAHAARVVGVPEPSEAEVRAAVGGGIGRTVRVLFGEARQAVILKAYLPHLEARMGSGAELLPGARELLDTLAEAGVTCGVLTNKAGDAARRLLEVLGVAGRFRAVCGAGDTPWLKPAPEFARHALEAVGAAPGDAALVGDSPWDVAAARNAGLAFAGVTTGGHGADELVAAGAARREVFPDLAAVARAWGVAWRGGTAGGMAARA